MPEIIHSWLIDPAAKGLIDAALLIVVVVLVAQAIKYTLSFYITDVDRRHRARKLINFFAFVVIVVIAISAFSEHFSGVTLSLGLAGAGIAFALQEVIVSIAGWIAIKTGGYYAPGDRIQIAGIKGDVIDISILRTTVMEIGEWVSADLYSGRVVRVPNSSLFKSPVFNYSGDFPFLWDELTLPVRYGSDWELARDILQRVADEVVAGYATQFRQSWLRMTQQYHLEEEGIEPSITLQATDNWIQFTVRYVVDHRKRRSTKDYLFRRILEEVDKTLNRVRLASATFELVSGSTLDVRLAPEQVNVLKKQAGAGV